MLRQSGRYPNLEYYLAIQRLPDDELFSPTQIANREFDKKIEPELFSRMFHAMYQFGDRNGLRETPDNCLRRPGGKPVLLSNGKAKLKEGERSAKWFGKAWKKQFFDNDIDHYKALLQNRLVQALSSGICQKKQAILPNKTLASVEVSSPRGQVKWLVIAMVVILLTEISFFNYRGLQTGYAVMRVLGPIRTLTLIRFGPVPLETLLPISRMAHQNGDYQTAEKLARSALKSDSWEIKPNIWQFLGLMEWEKENYQRAEEYLRTAYLVGESIGGNQQSYRSTLAAFYLERKDISNASQYVDLLTELPFSKYDGNVLQKQAQLAFLKNDFDSALAFSLQRGELDHSEVSPMVEIYSDIAFYYGLTGNLDQCHDYFVMAHSLAIEHEKAEAGMYNNINLFLYLKWSYKDYTTLRDSLLAHAKRKNDLKLMEKIHFVDRFTWLQD